MSPPPAGRARERAPPATKTPTAAFRLGLQLENQLENQSEGKTKQ